MNKQSLSYNHAKRSKSMILDKIENMYHSELVKTKNLSILKSILYIGSSLYIFENKKKSREIKLDSCIGQNQLSQLSFCMFTSKIRPCEVDE